jgi:hypothetical protein
VSVWETRKRNATHEPMYIASAGKVRTPAVGKAVPRGAGTLRMTSLPHAQRAGSFFLLVAAPPDGSLQRCVRAQRNAIY